ncbi:nucleotidyltransferase domain-containing protein [Rhodocista pekingensis]|uniref:Nucleotidyltransferase domain-containing protein n=1 Tax=Rhodocista pekingensis TaxID=201185 RepID=A0ABW2KZD7_9PROT
MLRPMDARIRPILDELKAGLVELYGDRLDRVILYGSQARGDARPDSDIDVLVVLRGAFDRAAEQRQLARLAVPIELRDRVIISPVLRTVDEIDQHHPFYRNVLRDGMRL